MIETALVFDKQGKTIHWHEPPNRTSGSIPDAQDLWDVLWDNRHRLGGVAHTHPWSGMANPSQTDLTTFAAVEKGLGRLLLWPVVTFSDVAYIVRDRSTGLYTRIDPKWLRHQVSIEGIDELRRRSGSENNSPA